MDQKQTLRDYIKPQLDRGVDVQVVRQQLIDNGWGAEIVDETIGEITPPPVVEPSSVVVESSPLATSEPSGLEPVRSVAEPVSAPTEISMPGKVQQNEAGGWSAVGNTHEPTSTGRAAVPGGIAPAVASAGVSVSEKYTISQVVSDVSGAIKANFAAVMISGLVGVFGPLLVQIAVIVLLVMPMALAMMAGKGSMLATILPLAGVFLIIVILTVITVVLAICLVGLAVNDGIDGKKSLMKELLPRALKRVWRVFTATILYNLYIMAPFLIIVAALILSMFLPDSMKAIVYVIGFAGLMVALIMTITMLFRYILMPTVALLEPELPIMQIRKRTKDLMEKGGMRFILIWTILIPLAGSIVFAILIQLLESINSDILTIIVMAPLGVLIYVSLIAVQIAFYRNRVSVQAQK